VQQYIIRRLVVALPVLFGITVINFLIINLAPGDPLSKLASPELGLSRQQLEAIKIDFGLDKPLPVRYVYWLGQAVRGNLGYRMVLSDPRPVGVVLMDRIPRTVELMFGAIVLAHGLGIMLGVFSALRHYSLFDYVVTVFTFLGVATPSFFFGLGVIVIFAAKLGWFPTSGVITPNVPPSLLDFLRHLFLPAMTLAVSTMAESMRQARTSMLEVINQDYVRTAQAKGLAPRIVVWRHAFRNALLPLITVTGLSIPALVGGAAIVETIFSWPGMGALAIDAVSARDYNTLMGSLLVGTIMVLVANLVTDVAYAYADPRIRYD
jgi:peptide/nickel transport system permease protein